MLRFLWDEFQFLLVIGLWTVTAIVAGPVVYGLLPLSVLLLKQKDQWPEMIFGFILVLVFSDLSLQYEHMAVFKGAKNTYILALALVFFTQRRSIGGMAGIFRLFLPFFLYSLFPLLFSPKFFVGAQKTLSYALLFLVVPNLVLHIYRLRGWAFFRNLMFFLTAILLVGLTVKLLGPRFALVGGRFRGLFGNPNGLGIFCFLVTLLMAVVSKINPRLFNTAEKVLIYGSTLYFLFVSGSRGSLTAVILFFTFNRFFSGSIFLGFMALLLFVGVFEVVLGNLEAIVTALGMEEFFRLRTLETGSGRYFAWQFAWEKVQEYFVFGGGFGTDEAVMRSHYDYLERMGHQGGVHNSYLSLWFDVGIVGLLIYFRSFFLLFIKASRSVPMAVAVMFAVLFSVTYESWLVGSLNPFTILLLIIMTMLTEEEIAHWRPPVTVEEDALAEEGTSSTPALPAPV